MKRSLAHAALVIAVTGLLGLTSCGSTDHSVNSSASQSALQEYHSFLEENAALLVDWSTQLRGQIVAGELGRAQSRYATSRVQYSHVEPVAQTFERLDARINAHADDVSSKNFGGFHRIEKALFQEESTTGLKSIAKSLQFDVEELRHRLDTAHFQPKQIARDASQMLSEVSDMKLAGHEEAYAHIDFVDIAANVEGAEAAFEAVRPTLVAEKARTLAKHIGSEFDATYEALKPYGFAAREPHQIRPPAAGASFVSFAELSPSEIRELGHPVAALERLLALLPSQMTATE